MKTVIEMAREAGIRNCTCNGTKGCLDRFASLVRADERARMAEQPAQQEPLEYWNAVEGWVKIDEVREHFDSVGCGTIYKTPGDGRVPLTTAQRKPLTETEIRTLRCDLAGTLDVQYVTFARAIEAAHGIKENT